MSRVGLFIYVSFSMYL